ncbi:MAG: antiterminator LoaP [Erysipelotrichales bacterium]|nr:antiterminator LoaP [Erysipelotrichales bacterium]
MKNWYVLFVKSRNETKICEALLRENYDAFIPMKEVIFRKSGMVEKVKKIMFPSYVFVETDEDYITFNENLKLIKTKVSGIVRNLKYDNEGTAPLTEPEIQLLNRLLGKKRVMEHSMGVIEGDRIIITEGPLMGFESQIIHVDRHKRQATLELDILGNKTTTKVSLEIISKI